MSAGSNITSFPAGAAAASVAPTKPARKWLLNGPLDLLFVANLSWPLLAWFSSVFAESMANRTLGFMLAFFLIMPHRWITLVLVFVDRNRFQQRSRAYLTVATTIIVGASLTQLSMGTLTLLLAIDFLWNAWHFAAQHGGIARMYEVQSRPGTTATGAADKYIIRTLVLFAMMRLASVALPAINEGGEWLTWIAPVMERLAFCDWIVICLPLILLAREVIDYRPAAVGRIAYLLSVSSLYGLMIYSVRMGNSAVTLGCVAAATMFHSAEYMAVVSSYVQKNKSLKDTKPFAYLVPRWTLFLLTFMAFCLLSAVLLRERYLYTWVWINLIVSYMHYAYDGMIWKRPKKQPAVAAA